MINTEKQHELLTFPNLSEDYSYVLEGFEENFKKLVAVAEEYPKTSVFSSYSLASFKKELLAVWGIAWNFRTELAEDIISIVHSFSGKLYGMRKSVKKKIDQELENEENPN